MDRDLPADTASLVESLRALDLTEVAVSAAIDLHGRLSPVGDPGGKTLAAAERLRSFGVLHGLLVAEAQKGVDERFLPILRAKDFHSAVRQLEAHSLPRRVVAEQSPVTFSIFGVPHPVPFDDYYRPLPLLKRVERQRLPRESDLDGSPIGERSRFREMPFERWDEQLTGSSQEYEEVPLERVFQEARRAGAPRLILTGSPGCGKTTALLHIAHQCLRGSPPLLIGGKRHLPLRVSLRAWEDSWTQANHPSLPEFIASSLREHGGAPSTELVQRWLRSGSALLLLDGLDELSSAPGAPGFHEDALKALLMNPDYRETPIILTCRAVSYENHRGLAPQMPVYTMGGLSRREQAAFVHAYPTASGSELDAEGLIAELRRLTNVRPLAANPLLLSVLCLVASGPQGVSLPATRGVLYEAAIGRILSRPPRVPPKEIYVGVAEPLAAEKKAYLEELALELWLREEGRQLISDEQTLIAALKRVLRRANEPMQLARCLVRDWVGNSGLLRRAECGRYGFLHLTVQEHLVATSLARHLNDGAGGGWAKTRVRCAGRRLRIADLLEYKAWDADWQEVICLLAGRLQRPEELLALLVGETSEEAPLDVGFWLLRLAGRCLGEIADVGAVAAHAERIVRQLAALCLSGSGGVRMSGLASLAASRPGRTAATRARGAAAVPEASDPQGAEAILLAALRDEPLWNREVVAQVLGAFGTPVAVDGLCAALRDEDWRMREAAAQALAALGTPAAEASLFAALRDEEWSMREAAARALGAGGTPAAAAALFAALRDEEWRVQDAAAQALGALGTPAAEAGLLAALRDEDSYVRGIAALALHALGTPAAVDGLLAALRDEECGVREAAALALAALRVPAVVEPLLAMLYNDDSSMQEAAAGALVALGTPAAVDGLLAVLRDEECGVREAAAQALGALGTPAAEAGLLSALREEDSPSVREAAAQALGALGTPAAEAGLLAALRDEWWSVREAAAQALGALGTPAAEAGLLAALRDEEGWVRKAAAQALGALGTLAAEAGLLAALRDEQWLVREAAAEALGALGTPAAEASLLAALRDEQGSVWEAAARALGALGTPAAVDVLFSALRDWPWVGVTLGQLMPGPARSRVLEHLVARWTADPDTYLPLWYELQHWVPALAELPGWPDWRARLSALSNLGLAISLTGIPGFAAEVQIALRRVVRVAPEMAGAWKDEPSGRTA